MPRLSKAQIDARSSEELKRARYAAQENKRAQRVQIDQNVVLYAWLAGVAIAFVTSAIVSFNGITSVATFVGLSFDWQAALFFGFIELAYLVFLVAYLVLASRVGDDGLPESTTGALVGMWFFAAVSIAANAFHTFEYHDWNFTSVEAWAGAVLSVSAPIAIISSSKLASRVVFAKSVSA